MRQNIKFSRFIIKTFLSVYLKHLEVGSWIQAPLCQRIGVCPAQEVLPEHLQETSWFPGFKKTSLHRSECGLQKLTASGTGQSDTTSGTGPVSGLHLLTGGRSKRKISVHLPCKRRVCLQRVLWPLKLRRELVSQFCLETLTESKEKEALTRDNYNN